VAFDSTPERGTAIIDLGDAYSRYVEDLKRGVMLVRGASPYVILQDEINIESGAPTWVTHTKATVAAEGSEATLTSGSSKLTMTILSPAGATFTSGEVDEKKWKANEQIGSFKGITVLKVALQGKGEQTLAIAFSPSRVSAHRARDRAGAVDSEEAVRTPVVAPRDAWSYARNRARRCARCHLASVGSPVAAVH